MVYKALYTKTAQKDLQGLPKNIAKRILRKIDEIILTPNPLFYAKKLVNFPEPTFRFRIGDYRVIFRLDARKRKLVILVVLAVAHRREVYERQ